LLSAAGVFRQRVFAAALAQLNPDGVSSPRHGGLARCGYPAAAAEFDRDLARLAGCDPEPCRPLIESAVPVPGQR